MPRNGPKHGFSHSENAATLHRRSAGPGLSASRGCCPQEGDLMAVVTYVGTAGSDGILHVLRQTRSETNDRETVAELSHGFHRHSPECAVRLAAALLEDCLRDRIRVLRLQQPLAGLLTSRLLPRTTWILTSVDIEAAVQAIEEIEGWLWLEEGFYLDQDPRLGSGSVH